MKHWSQYWKTNEALSSFAEGDAGEGYDAELKTFWEQAVADLPDTAVIVDIGSGNGALAALINEYGRNNGKKWQIHGVDMAEVEPERYLDRKPELLAKLQGVKFHSETDMADLPFEDNSVDCIVSQFAFEYGERDKVLPELLRVLKPQGQLVMMSHHEESQLIKDSEVGARVFDYALNNTPLFIQADLNIRLGNETLQEQDFDGWRQSQLNMGTSKTIQWLMHWLRDKYPEAPERVWVDDVINRVASTLNYAKDKEKMAQAARYLEVQYGLLQGHRLRLADQLAAAWSADDVKALQEAAARQHAKIEAAEPFQTKEGLLGWTLKMEKAAG